MTAGQREPHVFVVDDEATIANTLSMILQARGFESRAFSKAREALNAASESPPDLLITDVVMPGMSGIELAIQLRKQCPNCKILMFSGQASTFDRLAEASARGHDFEFVSKPIHPSDLLNRIRSLMET